MIGRAVIALYESLEIIVGAIIQLRTLIGVQIPEWNGTDRVQPPTFNERFRE
jgi:hypothetical protein